MNDILDTAEVCDYNYLKSRIKSVLQRYFETNDMGEPNPKFDENFSSEAAIDEIHEIIGDI